jgi:hypothetical protein
MQLYANQGHRLVKNSLNNSDLLLSIGQLKRPIEPDYFQFLFDVIVLRCNPMQE